MRTTADDEEYDTKTRGTDKTKKRKQKGTTHNHIGPNVKAYRAGLAVCPICDSEKIIRLTEKEKELEKLYKEPQRLYKPR